MEDNLKRIVSEATRLCRERGQQARTDALFGHCSVAGLSTDLPLAH
jgi:hypothetical protein